MSEIDGLSRYEQLVMRELNSIKADVRDLREEVVGVRIDVATLKVKAGIWGGMAGMIPALLTALAVFIPGGIGGP
jgi:hypothetical protein